MSLGASPDGSVHAAIDIGTNSVHLVVARTDDAGGFEVLASEKESVRLGSGSTTLRNLSPDAMDRGVSALQRFRQVAEIHGADVAAVATSAVREAENGSVFIDRAKAEAGVDVDIISGAEEGRLIHLGVLQCLPVFDQQILTVDIGGGSTELVVGRAARILDVRSVKLGHLRLTTMFFPGGEIRPGAVEECRRYIRAWLSTAIRALEPLGQQVAVGSSGTITTLGSLARSGRTGDGAEDNRLASISRAALDDLIRALIAAPDVEARQRAVRGLEAKRADVIVAGALLLEAIFDGFNIDQMLLSEFALREGVLLDRAHGHEGGYHHLSDIRRDSVLRMADIFEEDRSHVEHSTDLALELFDQLAELHGYHSYERNILEAAGLLHNVGLFVSHASHHKHSYYLIRNSDRLLGFTEREIELIAQVARYHRRSAPKPTHQNFMALDEVDQARVRLLSGMLRVAIALDRTRKRAVSDLTVSVGADAVQVRCVVPEDADPELELYTAAVRSELLAVTLERSVNFVVS